MALRQASQTPGVLTTDKDPQTSLKFVRATTLFIDVAVVSYVRSHAHGFDTAEFEYGIMPLTTRDNTLLWWFPYHWAKLAAYLDAFLDARKVWRFRHRSCLNPQSSQGSQYEDKSRQVFE